MNHIFLLFIFLSQSLYAQVTSKNDLSKSEILQIQKYEKEFTALLEKENVTNAKKFYLYLIAARDFHTFNVQTYYLKYLELAKNINTSEPKVEVYWRLINQHIKNNNYLKAKNLLKEWNKKNEKVSNYQKQLFQLLEMRVINKNHTSLSSEEKKLLNESMNSFQFNSLKLDQLIQSGQYEKALSMLNPQGIEEQLISSIVRFDLLTALVKRKYSPRPNCTNTYNKYPSSPSYSIQICKALMEYKKNGAISTTTLERIKKTLTLSVFEKERFLLSALKNLPH